MVQVDGKTITMTKGDSVTLNVVVTTQSGEPYSPSDGDTIRFAVKKDYSDTRVAILKQIPLDTMQLSIRPEDTSSLKVGEYVYDIELRTADGIVDTFIPRATLRILEEVL